MTCLDDETVLGLLEGRLAEPVLATTDEHLDTCDRCRDVVAQLARTRSPARVLARGHTLGRYVIGDLLGTGAMGRVYSAWQPELDRRVAIKVLRDDADDLHARLVREARAMARLDHPNVVGVHEVTADADGAFVVMDLVEGETLRAWAARPGPARERVRVAIEIARGLAAVHAAGVIHRDIKPDNVIVAMDGRARLGDFGLARREDTGGEAREPTPGTAADDPSGPATALAGTPVYMAPEVLRGGSATEASDQFSFGVTIYETIASHRPFAGATWNELAAAHTRAIPPLRGVPAWFEAAIRRCLASDPDRRFSSLAAVADHLAARAQRRRPAVWLAGLATAAVVASSATWFAVGRDAAPPAASCEGPALAEVWSTRALVRRTDFGPRAVAAIDRWTDAWKQQCVAARTAPVHGPARERCLDGAAASCRAARRPSVGCSHYPGGARSRSRDRRSRASPTECASAIAGSAEPIPLDPDRAAAVRDVTTALPRLRAALAFGDARPIAAAVTALVARARVAEHPPTLASALLVHAEVLRATSQLEPATVAARDAVVAAERGHDDALAARAWIARTAIAGERRDLASVADHAAIAHGAIDRAGAPPRLIAQLRQLEGLAAFNRNQLADARTLLADARTRFATLDGERSIQVAGIESALGSVARGLGELEVAERHHRTALAIDRDLRVASHPDLARDLHNLAGILRLRGELAAALALYDEALAMESALRGPTSFEAALTINSRGLVKLARGDLAGARADFEAALGSLVAAGHGDRAFARHNLGLVAAASGSHRAALAHFDVAVTWYAQTVGSEAAPAIRLWLDRARSHAALGNVAAARADAIRARDAATAGADPMDRRAGARAARRRPPPAEAGAREARRPETRTPPGRRCLRSEPGLAGQLIADPHAPVGHLRR